RGLLRCFSQSSSVISSPNDATTDLKLLFPSDSFMRKSIRRPSHREKLSSLISELQMFSEFFGRESLPKFDDSIWSTYFSIWSAEERCDFLNDLRLQQKNRVSRSIIADEDKANDGEVVYAARSYNFIELRGQDFRRVIDRVYGNRLLSLERCNEMLPKLVIDCRFLAEFSATVQSAFARQIQALHDSNWTSRIPFNISLVNFRPDGQLDGIVKIFMFRNVFRHLFFHYGPPSLATSFSAHPFAPTLTARSVLEACGVDSSDVMYISWRATRFIPETPPSNIRAVVVCASNDIQPWSSSVSAAQKEGINAYRLPIERYVRPTEKRKFFSLRKTSAILRSYFCGDNLDTAFNEVVESSPNQSHYNDSIERDLLQRYKNAIIMAAERSKEELSNNYSKKSNDFQKLLKKSVRTHRYTREERNKMRQ
ncbi:hypothetical protein Angca_001682, partial [Angiostrongylus cantonensis]